MTLTNSEAARHCECDYRAPTLREIRSPQFNRTNAQEVSALKLSGDGTVDWAYLELCVNHTGKLLPSDFEMAQRDSDDPLAIEKFDNLWSGKDQRRYINRYKERAHRTFRYRLKIHCVDSVVMLHFAMQIYQCRTTGRCSGTGG